MAAIPELELAQADATGYSHTELASSHPHPQAQLPLTLQTNSTSTNHRLAPSPAKPTAFEPFSFLGHPYRHCLRLVLLLLAYNLLSLTRDWPELTL